MFLGLKKRLATVRKLLSVRKSKKINGNQNALFDPSLTGHETSTADVAQATMLPESRPAIRSSPREEISILSLEDRIIRPPKPRSDAAADIPKDKALPTLPALPSLSQEPGNQKRGSRWGSPLLHRQNLLNPSSEVQWYHNISQHPPKGTFDAAGGPSFQTRSIDTLPEITVEEPEEAEVEAVSYHLKGPSALAHGYSSFASSSAMIFGPRSLAQDAIPSSGETSQQGLYNALGLDFRGHPQMITSSANERESPSNGAVVYPASEDISESDASLIYSSNVAAGPWVVGGLWTPTHVSSTDTSSDITESSDSKIAAARVEYSGSYLPATLASPIDLHAPLRFLPPAALFPPIEMPTSISAPPPGLTPYKIIYIERDSPAARQRPVLIGKGASAEVYRVSSYNGMYRVKKVVDLKKIDPISLEALKTELTVLTILKRDQMDVMYGLKKAQPGLEFMMQIPLDISQYIMINGRTKKLTMYSEYYPENLDMFNGLIDRDTPRSLMENVLYFLISEITQGLAYLHKQSVVHMDLKLENIFLTASRHCVIGDFGGAIYSPNNVYPWQDGVPSRCQTYTTHGFRAPEVTAATVDFNATFNCKADFWSLGVCMYKLLVPDGVNVQVIPGVPMREVGNDYGRMGLVPWVMRPRMMEVGCPREIMDLILNMTQHDPRWRMGEKSITRYLKNRHRYYKIHHPSPLQLLKPQASPIRTSQFERPIATGDDPTLYLRPESVARSLVYNMREYCDQELYTHFAEDIGLV